MLGLISSFFTWLTELTRLLRLEAMALQFPHLVWNTKRYSIKVALNYI